jgi:hypothetical protein
MGTLFKVLSRLRDLRALVRGPAAVVKRQARKHLHRAVNRKVK